MSISAVVRAVPSLVEMELLVQVLFLAIHESQQLHSPTQQRFAIGAAAGGQWEMLIYVVIVVHRQADLHEVADRLAPRRLPLGLFERTLHNVPHLGGVLILLVNNQDQPIAVDLGR